MLPNGYSRFDRKSRRQRIEICVDINLGGVNIQFFAPYQLRLLTLFNNRLEEAPKDIDAVAGADAAQTEMIGEGIIQIIAKDTSEHSDDRQPGA